MQLVPPNLNTVAPIGYCLSMVENVFSTPHNPAGRPDDCATDEWNAAQFKHFEIDMPNVSIPVWFSYWATIDGIYKDWGHVITWVPEQGRFLSSPYNKSQVDANGNGSTWFDSIAQCEKVLGCSYVGYSLDLAGIKLAEEADVSTVGEVEFNDLFTGFFGPITAENPVWDSDRKSWIGAETNTVIREMYADPRQQEYADSHTGDISEYEVYIPPTQYIKKG